MNINASKLFLSPREIRTQRERDNYTTIWGYMQADRTNFREGFFPRGLFVINNGNGFFSPYIGFAYVELSTGEDAWTPATNVTASLDSETPTGDYSVKLEVGDAVVVDTIIGSLDFSSRDISAATFIKTWIKSSVPLAEGDYELLTSSSSGGVSPEISAALPAIPANTWIPIIVPVSAGSAATISVGMEMKIDKGIHTIWIADTRTAQAPAGTAVGVLKEEVYFNDLNAREGNINGGTSGYKAKIYSHGEFFLQKLVGYDDAALSDLNGVLKEDGTVISF